MSSLPYIGGAYEVKLTEKFSVDAKSEPGSTGLLPGSYDYQLWQDLKRERRNGFWWRMK